MEKVKLSDVCCFISRGVTPKYTECKDTIVINQKCIRDGKVSFEQSRFTDTNKKKITIDKFLHKYDTLINSTGTGTLGRVAIYKHDTKNITVDSHVTIVRANDIVDPVYLGYNLISQQNFIESLAEGSTVSVNRSTPYKLIQLQI